MPIFEILSREERRARDAQELLPEHLDGFRRSQRLAYACCEAVAKELHEGITEQRVVERMHEWLHGHGVREFFHTAVAWFGDRTTLPFDRAQEFAPTDRPLELGMPAILDVAPMVDGYTSDVGYPCHLGENALQDQMIADLEPYRALILEGVRKKLNLSKIYWEVDRLIEKQGYENRHQKYGGRVLGHRVSYVLPQDRSERVVFGFGTPALQYMYGRGLAALRRQVYLPLWNDRPVSDHPAEPGLWAVEPHLGFRGTGAKWEEILVVTQDDAFWLDDDLPHVRSWKKRNATQRTQASHAVHA